MGFEFYFEPFEVDLDDKPSRSVNFSGVDKWNHPLNLGGIIMIVLGWLTIPFEVVLRRDFGQRWFNMVSFFAGLFLLGLVYLLQSVWTSIWNTLDDWFSWAGPFNIFSDPVGRLMGEYSTRFIYYFAVVYLLVGLYHLFKIKWRDQIDEQLYSLDDGTSRLWPLGYYAANILNFIAAPLFAAYYAMLPDKQKYGDRLPKLISDPDAFTNTFFEPFAIRFIAGYCVGVTRIWLYVSAIALLIHATWRERARKNKMLDLQDSKIQAEHMREMRYQAATRKAWEQAKETAQQQQPSQPEPVTYPPLRAIITQLHEDLKTRSKSTSRGTASEPKPDSNPESESKPKTQAPEAAKNAFARTFPSLTRAWKNFWR